MRMEYDVIIVGARCAGATLAVFLGRAGLKVLLLDSVKMPRDMTLSTHFIQGAGMKVLDEIGLGSELRKIAPATRFLHSYLNNVHVKSEFNNDLLPYCVRRVHVDSLLQAEAQTAGAEFLSGTTVVDIICERGRVVGVVTKADNNVRSYRARLVVGADGPHSIIARLTHSRAYIKDSLQVPAFWAYVKAPKAWHSNQFYETDMIVEWADDGYRSVFQTDGDALLFSASSPQILSSEWEVDEPGSLLGYLSKSSHLSPLLHAPELIGRPRHIKKADFYLRKPIGAGYFLLGDAGCRKHFVSGQGMTEAFIEAKNLSKVIVADTPSEYKKYWGERDRRVLPLYLDAKFQSNIHNMNTHFIRTLFSQLAKSPENSSRLTLLCNRKIQPKKLFTSSMLVNAIGQSISKWDTAFFHGLVRYLNSTATSDLSDHFDATVARYREKFPHSMHESESTTPANS